MKIAMDENFFEDLAKIWHARGLHAARKPILLSVWLPTGEAMMEDLKERSLLLAGCCCLRLTCYILVSLHFTMMCLT